MAFRRNYRKNNNNRKYNSSSKKNKYTSAESIAFRLGQEQRVRKSINSANKNSRVYDAFCKGFNGVPTNNTKKPLFGE